MKNIIPFKKEIIFKTNISEVTSISLENTLNLDKDKVTGEFIVSGEYKVTDSSKTVEPFDLHLPFEIMIAERYDTSKAIIDIDDFYYEIVNDSVLSISIDVLIDKLDEKPLMQLEDLADVTPVRDIIEDFEEVESIIEEDRKEEIMEEIIKEAKIEEPIEERCIDESDTSVEVADKIDSLFNQFGSDNEVYVTYNVFIVREGDTLESILEKYNITEEELKKYNDLSNLKLGDKLIIPNTNEKN